MIDPPDRLCSKRADGRQLTMLTMMMAHVAGTDSSSRTPTLALGLLAPAVESTPHTSVSRAHTCSSMLGYLIVSLLCNDMRAPAPIT